MSSSPVRKRRATQQLLLSTRSSSSVASSSSSSPSSGPSEGSLTMRSIRWHVHPRGVWSTEIGGVPRDSPRIAAFDFDGTIVTTKSGKKFPVSASDWCYLYEDVPRRIRELHTEGYKILIFSNQNGARANTKGTEKMLESVKNRLSAALSELLVPVQVFFATEKNEFRKPFTGMFDLFQSSYNGSCVVDRAQSFFVGDAAGRIASWKAGAPADFSCSDRKFAVNVGLQFFTPEEFFLHEPVLASEKWSWMGFDPRGSNFHDVQRFSPPDAPLAREDVQELILFVGMPGSGKSTFYRRYLEKHQYSRVNRDTLGDTKKCHRACEEQLRQGKSVVVDNTNPSAEDRQVYLSLAKANNVPARCFRFNTPTEIAKHLNNIRSSASKGETPLIPEIAYRTFSSRLEEPTLNEGFDQVVYIEFIPEFDDVLPSGTDTNPSTDSLPSIPSSLASYIEETSASRTKDGEISVRNLFYQYT